ncbi:hypothetical protein EC973_008186 [Apophysomyces ossiformis]|uniref:Uncharacterized protein n=1 Tax=Apophysomyces ossiformis TaxID=679940 RepID=A0A8H7EJL3_9FUNG|nr:hypothetical protein EC973_008186 [Apophysomyces ossiformis]
MAHLSAFVSLAYNSIIYLSDDTKKFLECTDREFEQFEQKNEFSNVRIANNNDMAEIIEDHLQLRLTIEERYLDSLKFVSISTSHRRMYRIYSRMMEAYAYRQADFNNWKNMTEKDIMMKFYLPIFEILFENSPIQTRLGESENSESREVRKVREHADSRGAYKVDLRLVIHRSNKWYDVANMEFAKNGDVVKKNVSDAAKFMVEGKCILDQIVRIARLSEEKAKKICVVNLQICAMKAALMGLKLRKNGEEYVAQKLGPTMRYPTSEDRLPIFFKTMLPYLFYMKEQAEKNALMIQSGLNHDSSKFGSQSPTPDAPFLKETWLGPKHSKRSAVPRLPNEFF